MTVLPAITSIGVIVGRDLVGDALIKLPFLRALRAAFPLATISWITSNGPTAYNGPLRDLTQHLIDRIYEQPAWMASTTGLSSAPLPQGEGSRCGDPAPTPDPRPPTPSFDLLIDTRNRWKLARQARRIPHKIFLAQAFHYLFSDRRPSLFRRHPEHIVDRLLEMVTLAAGTLPPVTGRLPVAESYMARARQLLPVGPTYIGLAPGAGNRIKAWPRYKFEKLAILQAEKGRVPVFLLGPAELSWLDELTAAVPEALFPLQAADVWGGVTIGIEQTLAIGSLLALAVANDSGTGHMLAAVDCPLISLFGPTAAAKLAPRVSHGTVIKAQDFGGTAMHAITWEAVDAAIDRFFLQQREA